MFSLIGPMHEPQKYHRKLMRFSQLVNLGLCILQLCGNDVFQAVDYVGTFAHCFIGVVGVYHSGGCHGGFVVGAERKAIVAESSADDYR